VQVLDRDVHAPFTTAVADRSAFAEGVEVLFAVFFGEVAQVVLEELLGVTRPS